jgi:YVTN family beta-propeller protein
MYRLNEAGTALIRMNPRTLADMKGQPSIRLAPPGGSWPTIVSTPSGTTLAAELDAGGGTTTPNLTIRVIDLRSGKPRSRTFHPAVRVWISGISADGSELYAWQWPEQQLGPPPTIESSLLYTLSAANGRVLRSTTLATSCCEINLLDAAHQRFYSLITAHSDDPHSASQLPELMAEDLASGRELGRLSLPGLQAGSWNTDRQVDGMPLIHASYPGVAVSPDGRRIAILDGSSNRLTVIDTADLRVIQSVALARPQSPWERLGAWLGLIPQMAYAKGEEGTALDAQFSPDGRLLYVMGIKGSVTKQNTFASTRLGLRVVDAASGAILADRFHGKPLVGVDVSPDGRVYASLAMNDQGIVSPCPCNMLRLDPRTLVTRASRLVQGLSTLPPQFLFLASTR